MNPPSTARIGLALALGWLVPGAGHVLFGRKAKAVYFGVLILILFVIGFWLGDERVVSANRYGLYLLAQIWVGGPTLLALVATQHLRVTYDIHFHDAGLLFTAVAGLLNLVVLVDLYEIYLRERGEQDAATRPASRLQL